jgi:hypothetical protein
VNLNLKRKARHSRLHQQAVLAEKESEDRTAPPLERVLRRKTLKEWIVAEGDEKLSEDLYTLNLVPIHGSAAECWEVQLQDELLTLLGPDKRTVMMIPQADAVRNVRFHRGLLKGWIVSFTLMEGMRSYSFRCDRKQRTTLLAWLPTKDLKQSEREIQLHGAAVTLAGAMGLLFQSILFWGCAMALVILGLVAACFPNRSRYAMNGLALLTLGVLFLFYPIGQVATALTPEELHLLNTALGAGLLLWGIQQFSQLSVNARLRAARDSCREERVLQGPHTSTLVRRVAGCAVVFAVLFGGYATALYLKLTPETDTAFTLKFATLQTSTFNDILIFLVLTLLLLTVALLLLFRKRPPYLEARITAQLIIIVAVLSFWGFAAAGSMGETLSFSRGILSAGLLRFDQPYVWLPLIVLLILFNKWFLTKVEKEISSEEV